MIHAWRLVKTRFASSAFDGEGARLYGGRWSSPGTVVAYASESIALATLEVLVHLQESKVLPTYSLVGVSFPAELVTTVDPGTLPAAWRSSPAPSELRAIGDQWVREGRSAVLRVPSAVIPSAGNFLINPGHPDAGRVVVDAPEPFELDRRLVAG